MTVVVLQMLLLGVGSQMLSRHLHLSYRPTR